MARNSLNERIELRRSGIIPIGYLQWTISLVPNSDFIVIIPDFFG